MTAPTDPRPLRVLLATDGSARRATAAECLARFPLPPNSVLLMLSVVTIRHPHPSRSPGSRI